MSFAHKVVLWVVQRRWLDLMNTPLSLSGKVQSERVQRKLFLGDMEGSHARAARQKQTQKFLGLINEEP